MTAFFVPSTFPRTRRAVARPVRVRRSDTPVVTWCALALVLLLEAAVLFVPHVLVVSPVQATPAFKMVSGYAMLGLLVFAMTFGWLRRLPALAGRQRRLNDIHQFAGFLLLVLLASHIAQKPAGFLLYTFHAMAVGLGAGALRAWLGPRMGRAGSTALLVLHIGLCCLVAAAVLLHLYFVYAYTA